MSQLRGHVPEVLPRLLKKCPSWSRGQVPAPESQVQVQAPVAHTVPRELWPPPPACSLVKWTGEERDVGRDPGEQQTAQTLAPLFSPLCSPVSSRAPQTEEGLGPKSTCEWFLQAEPQPH